MSQIDLQKKFPNMTPVGSSPTMFQINGCGFALYGRRDVDEETGAYVATWCVSFLFVPLIALRAYRVARAERGWYFLGREPLSQFAKVWNLALLGIVLVGVGISSWVAYTGTPAYKAKQQMAEARQLVGEGKLVRAAEIYQRLSVAGAEQSAEATTAIKGLVEVEAQKSPLEEAAGVFAAAAQVARRGQGVAAADVVEKALVAVAGRGDWEPRGGIAVLDAVRPLTVDTRKIDDRRFSLLKKWAEGEPQNLDVVIPLASLYEQRNQLDEAKKLLLPVKDKLGEGEGARVLGTVWAREQDYDGAYALLWPYVKGRLDKLHVAERDSESLFQRLWDKEIDLLKRDKGPRDFYQKLDAASDAQKQTLVREYVNGQIKDDPQFALSQETLEKAASVVPVALELGIVMLERAQHQPDPAVRKTQLESAEQVFLAVGGVAGESDAYRMSLGQVYYWLGKQADGKKLFDELLAAKGRSSDALLGVADKMRDLGAESEARTLAEEAYAKGSGNDQRYAAALFRSLCAKDGDEDDEIAWLNKADTTMPHVKARLAATMGEKAMKEGHDAEAASQFRAAIAAYGAMPRTASTLNQTALACFSVFQLEGDHQMLERGVDSFQQAVDLSPSDPILLYNAGVTLESAALGEVIGGEIDLHLLRETGKVSLFRYLYRDQAGHDAVVARMRAHPGVNRAISFLEKVMVLAPKNTRAYDALYEIRQFYNDEAGLQDLEQRIKAADIDTSDRIASMKEHISGAKDDKFRMALSSDVKRDEALIAAARAKGSRTAAVALSHHVEQVLALDQFTGMTDADQVVAMAEEADRLAPSSSTSGTVMAARLFRAQQRLSRTDPAFREFANKYNRSLGSTYLMAVAAGETGPLQREVLADPDVRQVVERVRAEAGLFPEGRSPFEWELLRAADAQAAEQAAEAIRHEPWKVVEQSIANRLRPASAAEAVETNWLMQVLGRPEDGRAVVSHVAALGIPVPQ